jgi:hypothetical protein
MLLPVRLLLLLLLLMPLRPTLAREPVTHC